MKKKKNIKVAFMIPGLGKIQRGAQTTITNLALSLNDDYQVAIFSMVKANEFCRTNWAISHDSRFLRRIDQFFPFFNRLAVGYFASWLIEIEALTFSFPLLLKLLKEDFDIFFPVSIWGVIMARILRAIKGTKFIYINHGGAENFILKQKPDAFVALTPDVLRWAMRTHPGVKSVLIPDGIDFSKFSPNVKPAKLSLQRPIFLCVAALVPYKRVELTIRAVARLKRGSLLILGKGELEQDLNRLGARLLGPKRFLLKSVSYEQIPSFYAGAGVFTLASHEEIFGSVYIEALASNLPVVAPKDERRKFIIGEAGVLCQVGNINDYSRALKKAAETNFGSRPRRQAEKFSFEKTVERHNKLIRELLNQEARIS